MRLLYLILFCGLPFFLTADSLYCVKYGESTYNSRYIFFNDRENKEIKFEWLFYLFKDKDKVILIDCGFYSKSLINIFKIAYKNPIDILKNNNFSTESITDIILTHSHFDHIENVIYFKNANIYIQEDELNSFLNSENSNKEVVRFLKNNKKVFTFREKYNLGENIIIKKIGGHTIGSSVVEIYFKNKKILLTSDEMYIKENFIKKIGVGTYFNHKKNIDFINSIPSDFEILFFHESQNQNKEFWLLYDE